MGNIGVERKKLFQDLACTAFQTVEIETQTACNRKCHYCPNSVHDRSDIANNKQMESELFCKVIDELAEIKYYGRLSPHMYNEPLMDERLPDLLSYARKKLPNVYIQIYTNGDFLDLDLYRTLIDVGINDIYFTQHTEELPEGINEVVAYRKKYGDDSVRILHQKFTENKKFLNRGGTVVVPEVETRGICCEISCEVAIDYRGNVLICPQDYLATTVFGNVKHEKLLDIWFKPEFLHVKFQAALGKFEKKVCQECAYGDSVRFL